MDNAPLRSDRLPNKMPIPNGMPLVRGDTETQGNTGFGHCFLFVCFSPELDGKTILLKTPYTLLIGLEEMVLIILIIPYRLTFIGPLMTHKARYAHGFNTGINGIKKENNHCLIGFIPTPQEITHAWHCKPDQKLMADDLIGPSDEPIATKH